MTVPDYRVLFADLVDNTIREEVDVHDLAYTSVLNAPGELGGWVSLDDPKCTRANIDPGATAVYVERGGLLVWGGILWAVRVDTVARKLELSGQGFWSYFRHLFLRQSFTYTATDQIVIARGLVNYGLAKPGALSPFTVGTETCGVLRDVMYHDYERKNLGEAVEGLAKLANGFDFEIEVAWNAAGTVPVRTFRFYYPQRGSRVPGVVFNHNVQGLSKLSTQVDATRAANQVDVIGSGDGDTTSLVTQSDLTALGTYPLLEDIVTNKDVTDWQRLLDLATAEVGRRNLPTETPSIEKDGSIWPDVGSFDVGDEVYVVAHDAWVSIDSFQRVQSIAVRVSDEGVETVVPTFTSADVG